MRPFGKLQYTSGMLKVTFAEGFGAPIDVRAELPRGSTRAPRPIGPIPAHHLEEWV